MNLWLRKIETDLSRKLKEDTRDTKVHRKKLRKVDNNVKKPCVDHNLEDREKNSRNKKFLTIDGEFTEGKILEVEAQFPEVSEGQPSRGIFLDAKK